MVYNEEILNFSAFHRHCQKHICTMIFLISGLEHMTGGVNLQSSTAQRRVVEKVDQTCFRSALWKDKRQRSQVAARVTFTRYKKKTILTVRVDKHSNCPERL